MLSNGSLLRKRYLIKDKLGAGLAGHTYLAKDLFVPDSLCAIKELGPQHEKGSLSYEHIRKKFQEEAKCLRALAGYNGQVPQLYDEFPENDTLYIVQEYIEGETLQSLLRRESIKPSRVRDLLVSLLKVVVYVHSKDILHRDIKPANIILRAGTEIPVLIDFGSGKDLDETQVGASDDISKVAFFSEGYTAPEQMSGDAVAASDIYSLGKTAIQMLSSRSPKTLSDHTWRDHVKGLLPELAEVIDKSISPHLAQRYEHAVDMLNELEKLVFPEDRENFATQISHSLTIVEREPRPFSKVSRKCEACDFVLTLENEFCPNCAQYNPLKLDERQFLLHCGSAEEYFNKIVRPKMSSEDQVLLKLAPPYNRSGYRRTYDQPFYVNYRSAQGLEKQLWDFINDRGAKTINHRIFLNRRTIEAIALAPVAVFWGISVMTIVEMVDMPLTIYWVIPTAILTLITLAAFEWCVGLYPSWSIGKLRGRQRRLEYARDHKIEWIEKEKEKLRNELAERSKVEKQNNRALREREKFIDARITEITNWIGELKSLLSEISDEKVDNEFQHQHAIRLSGREQRASQIQKQYQSKKLEVGLLRINNLLQKEGNVAQMTHKVRISIKKNLKDIIQLCNQMSTNLKEADVANTTEGSESLLRILEIGKIASRLWQHLVAQDIELALPGRTSDRSLTAREFLENLALLNAYICIDDFSTELDRLEREFARTRGGGAKKSFWSAYSWLVDPKDLDAV